MIEADCTMSTTMATPTISTSSVTHCLSLETKGLPWPSIDVKAIKAPVLTRLWDLRTKDKDQATQHGL